LSETENKEQANTPSIQEPMNKENNRSVKPSFLFALSQKMASSKYLKWALIALLPVLVLLRYPADRLDGDMWWHMAMGKYYIANHTLMMDHSIFSWTPTDPTWIYNTCLGSIAMYLFYSLAGGFGLWAFQWLVFLGVFLSFYLFLRLLGQKLDVTHVTVIAAIGVACFVGCRFYKPELFSALLFSWLVFVYFYVKVTRKINMFYIYPVLFALWVNLHGAFVMGLVFLAIVFAGEILNRMIFPRESFTTKELVHLGAACLLSLAATLINPYGIDYLLSTYNIIAYETYSEQNKNVLAWLSLWPYLKAVNVAFFRGGITAWITTIMMFFVLSLSVYEIIKKRTLDFALLLVSIALYWKGMETARTSYLFPIAFFFVFFYLMIYRLHLRNILNETAILPIIVFFFLFISIFYYNIRYGAGDRWFGAGIDSFVPVKEVEFLKKHKPQGPMFNDDITGAYLTWALYPEYKVFLDSRASVYYETKVFPDYIEFVLTPATKESIALFREKYPFKFVILHYRHMSLIFDLLKAGDDWRLLYFEKNAAILIHKSLLPAIHSEVGNENLSPLRFRGVKNPDVLLNVFNFYVHLNPAAGRYILNIYRNNISDYYKPKQEHLRIMESMLFNKERANQKKIKLLSP
jgi:hypothetical protein